MDEDRRCTVCVALLGQYNKVEALLEGGCGGLCSTEDGTLDYSGFSALVDAVEVQCSEPDKRAIFQMVDSGGRGTVDAAQLRAALRSSGAITRMYSESLRTFALLLAATLAFDLGVYALRGDTAAFDFLAAYAVEDSLSVDNLFVFLLIFRYFKVPPQLVDTCLNYGISGSILLRGVFIFAGLAAVKAFEPLLLGFSVFLLFSSYQLLAGGEEEEEDAPPEVVTSLLGALPITGTFEGRQFFVRTAEGAVRATQLTGTLVCIALCDVLFAVDSIPAVLGVTSDPFVVYTSNIAAVVGLRSLYQILSVAVADLVYLESAVALVLGFVGLKLGAQVFGYELSSAVSLGVILSTLVGSVLLSLAADAQGNAAAPAPAADGTTSEGGGTPSDSDAAPSNYSPDAWTTGPR